MLKAFRAYTLNGELNTDLSGLAALAFHPCTEQELERTGFVPVLGDNIVHNVAGNHWFKIKKEKKQIPASSVADKLKTLLSAFENEHGRKAGKKEKAELKEKVLIELASRALPSFSYVEGYFNAGEVVILTSSASAAEEALALLRKALGSLPASHYFDGTKLYEALQSWFRGENLPSNVTVGHQAKLSSMDEQKSTASIQNDELNDSAIQALLSNRCVVTLELAITDKASFLIKHDGSINKIAVSDAVMESHNNDQGSNEDEAAQLEANMILKSAIATDILQSLQSVSAKAPAQA